MKLWLDDIRPSPKGWVWARTNEQAKEYLLTGEVTECSLDHDLGYHDVDLPEDPDEAMEILILRGVSEETGLQLVEWMLEQNLVPSKIRIHSWNPSGTKNMAARLNHFGHDCLIAPFDVKEMK